MNYVLKFIIAPYPTLLKFSTGIKLIYRGFWGFEDLQFGVSRFGLHKT
jgi:hypothetical protein